MNKVYEQTVACKWRPTVDVSSWQWIRTIVSCRVSTIWLATIPSLSVPHSSQASAVGTKNMGVEPWRSKICSEAGFGRWHFTHDFRPDFKLSGPKMSFHMLPQKMAVQRKTCQKGCHCQIQLHWIKFGMTFVHSRLCDIYIYILVQNM